MSRMATDFVGDFLRNAGFVSAAHESNAQQVAGKTGLPVGRVLSSCWGSVLFPP